jgi:hypothetical protein
MRLSLPSVTALTAADRAACDLVELSGSGTVEFGAP